MANRKQISKKIRFEVFKRDSFTCQYCGRKPPETILHLDHIHPVSKGGGNEILNLVTSCADCNHGKKDRPLSDSKEIDIQKEELSKLAKKRDEIEFLADWRKWLKETDKAAYDLIIDMLNEWCGDFNCSINPDSDLHRRIKRWVRKYEISEIVGAIEHFRDKDAHPEKAISNIPGQISINKLPDSERNYRYLNGIIRNRFGLGAVSEIGSYIKQIIDEGADYELIKALAINSQNFSEFCRGVNEL